MLVRLTPEGERLVARDVAAGQYNSPEEAVETALRLAEAYRNGELEMADPELAELLAGLAPRNPLALTDADALEALRRDIQEGIDSGSAGTFDSARYMTLIEETARAAGRT